IRGFNPDHPIPDINEWLLENGPIHEEDLYIPVLIDEEQPAAPIMRICNLHGGRKPAGHELQADRDIGSMQFCLRVICREGCSFWSVLVGQVGSGLYGRL